MPRLSQDAFLNALTKFFETNKEKGKGAVQLSFKRCAFPRRGRLRPLQRARLWIALRSVRRLTLRADCLDEEAKDGAKKVAKDGAKKPAKQPGEGEHVCLIHARLGKRKVSTLVPARDLIRFQQQFSTILRVYTDALKKREKAKAKREKKERLAPKSPQKAPAAAAAAPAAAPAVAAAAAPAEAKKQ
jgi:hypothetical protein